MHALTVLVAAGVGRRGVRPALPTSYDALSVSVEDADAGSAAEQPRVRRARRRDGAAAGTRPPDRPVRRRGRGDGRGGRRCGQRPPAGGAQIEAIAPVDERDWVRLTQSQFGPIEIDARLLDRADLVEPCRRRRARHPPRPRHGLRHRHPSDDPHVPALDRAAQARPAAPWPRVLDYGCGSGVLAIAAALLRRRRDRRRRHRPGSDRGDARQRRRQRRGAARRRRRRASTAATRWSSPTSWRRR